MKISTMLSYAGGFRQAAARGGRAGEGRPGPGVGGRGLRPRQSQPRWDTWPPSPRRVEIGSAILPIYTRTPTLIAMTAAGIDTLSEGRFHLGLGSSGPQVIEGWHGVPFDAPLGRTREIVDVCRQVWAREAPLVHQGRYYDMPLPAGEGTGLGKALKIIAHPVRLVDPHLGGRAGREERGHDRRAGRRLDPHALHAREGPRRCGAPRSTPARPSGDPSLGPLQITVGGIGGHRRGRRRDRPARAGPAHGGPLRRGDGGQGQATSTTTWSAATASRRRRRRSRTSISRARRPRPRRWCPTNCSSPPRCAAPRATWPNGSPAFRAAGVTHLQVIPVPLGDQRPVDIIAKVKELIG